MIDFILEIFTYQAENVNYAIGPLAMMAIGGGIKALASYDWGGKRRKAAARARRSYEEQRQAYQDMEITNPFAGIADRFGSFENVYEDVTVNQQQAEFEKRMFQQSQANIMANLQGAAGASGVAGLAQALANQGITQAQKASASIAQQEARNRMLAAQQEGKMQTVEAKGLMMEATGEQQRMAAEMSRQATVLGMEAQGAAAAKQAQMQGQQAFASGIGSMIGGYAGMGGKFDINL